MHSRDVIPTPDRARTTVATIAATSTLFYMLTVSCTQHSNRPSTIRPAPKADPKAKTAGSDNAIINAANAANTNDDPREQLMHAVLSQARGIQDDVAALRQLKFIRPVPAERQSQTEFRKFVVSELRKYYPKQKSQRATDALYHLGVIAEHKDLVESAIEVAAGQVAAYYNPETGRFYAVTLSGDLDWLKIMTAHELVHGLQDQHFDLRRYMGEPSPASPTRVELSEDQLNARRFVVEGEATFVMFMAAIANTAKVKKLNSVQMLTARMVVSTASQTPWQDMVANADQEATRQEAQGKPPTARLSTLPPYVVVPTLESYTKGAESISVIQGHGGWQAVADLYTHPPDSTEQMLHPQDKLLGTRDRPTTVTLPDFSGRFGSPIFTETLGELGWRIYLESWKTPAAAMAAAGWDGDALTVYKTDQGYLGLIAFIWDTKQDAIEWERALGRTASARTGTKAMVPAKAGSPTYYERKNGTTILIIRKNNKVFVVDGANGKRARTLLENLIATTTFR